MNKTAQIILTVLIILVIGAVVWYAVGKSQSPQPYNEESSGANPTSSAPNQAPLINVQASSSVY